MKFNLPASASKPAWLTALGVGIGISAAAVFYSKESATEDKTLETKVAPDTQEQDKDALDKPVSDTAVSSPDSLQIVQETAVVVEPTNADSDGASTDGTKRSVREMARFFAESAFASPRGGAPATVRISAAESHANVSVRSMAMYFDHHGPFGVHLMEDCSMKNDDDE